MNKQYASNKWILLVTSMVTGTGDNVIVVAVTTRKSLDDVQGFDTMIARKLQISLRPQDTGYLNCLQDI